MHNCLPQYIFQFFNFAGGVIVGAVIQRNGFLSELGIILPGGQNYYYDDYGTYIGTNYIDDRYIGIVNLTSFYLYHFVGL